jgi:hypothetical protein
MMRIHSNIFRCLLTACMLCGFSHMASAAFDYEQVAQPALWDKTPTLTDDMNPTYQFRSTSSYTPIVGTTSYTSDGSGPIGEPRRSQRRGPWDPPEDDPIGVIPSQPIGDVPWVLILLLAGGYIAYSRKRKSSAV